MLARIRQLLHRASGPDSLGRRGETLSAKYLRAKGYRILLRNYDPGGAEIDIVALDGDTLVFVEVKTRQSEDIARPEDQVNLHKQRQITKAARRYIAHYKTPPRTRFDVVAIVWAAAGEPVIRHHTAAFTAAF